ncbi:unnamed protein product, partial [Polarella glacialis]
ASADEPWFESWGAQRVFADLGKSQEDKPRRIAAHREVREGGPSRQKGSTIFVGGLSQPTENGELKAYFSRYGDVLQADIRKDHRTQRSKGFGFVTFSDASACDGVFRDLQNHVIDGKWVDVKRYGHGHADDHAGGADVDHRAQRRDEPSSSASNGQRRGREERPLARYDGPSSGRAVEGRSERYSAPMPEPRRPPEAVSSRAPGGDIRWFTGLAEAVPPQYLELDYCITCSLPSAQCGALIGRRGENINEVERKTGAKVQLSKKDQGSDHRSLSIVGPLLAVYAAHMLLMRDYNDAAAEPEPPARSREEEKKIEELQRQIDSLKQQMGGGTPERQGKGPERQGKGHGRR